MAHGFTLRGVLILVGTLLIVSVSAQQLCAPGEERCGLTCYNPEFKRCLGNPSGVQHPCFKLQSLCANDSISSPQCYDPRIQDCHFVPLGQDDNGEIVTEICFKGQALCQGGLPKCYNPGSEDCFPAGGDELNTNTIICGKGEVPCGLSGFCFNPSVEDCYEGSVRDFSCYKGQLQCGSTCYNNVSQVCLSYNTTEGEGYTRCAIGQRICEGACYNPLTADCVD